MNKLDEAARKRRVKDEALIPELRKQFNEMMASQGQANHLYHLENYQCLVLNLAPMLIELAEEALSKR